MLKPRSLPCFLLLCAVLAIAPSCATHKQKRPRPEESKAVGSGSLSQAKTSLSTGNYKKALDSYGAAFDQQPDNEDLLDAYTEALESVKDAADKVYAAQDYARAGELYYTIAQSGFTERPLQGELTFDDDYLAMRIGACSKMLIEQGIMKYRSGDLQGAITTWNKVLVFNPSDSEAKNSIGRATTQLKNLNQIK